MIDDPDGLITVKSSKDRQMQHQAAGRVAIGWALWMLLIAVDWAGCSRVFRHSPAELFGIKLAVVAAAVLITMDSVRRFGRALRWWP